MVSLGSMRARRGTPLPRLTPLSVETAGRRGYMVVTRRGTYSSSRQAHAVRRHKQTPDSPPYKASSQQALISPQPTAPSQPQCDSHHLIRNVAPSDLPHLNHSAHVRPHPLASTSADGPPGGAAENRGCILHSLTIATATSRCPVPSTRLADTHRYRRKKLQHAKFGTVANYVAGSTSSVCSTVRLLVR